MKDEHGNEFTPTTVSTPSDTPRMNKAYATGQDLHVAGCVIERELATANAQIVALQTEIEDARSAFGFHPEHECNLSDEIRRVRDEGREHFHDVTKLSVKLATVIRERDEARRELTESAKATGLWWANKQAETAAERDRLAAELKKRNAHHKLCIDNNVTRENELRAELEKAKAETERLVHEWEISKTSWKSEHEIRGMREADLSRLTADLLAAQKEARLWEQRYNGSHIPSLLAANTKLTTQRDEAIRERDSLARHPDISQCQKGHRFRTIASHPAKSEREWECPHCLVADLATARREAEEAEEAKAQIFDWITLRAQLSEQGRQNAAMREALVQVRKDLADYHKLDDDRISMAMSRIDMLPTAGQDYIPWGCRRRYCHGRRRCRRNA